MPKRTTTTTARYAEHPLVGMRVEVLDDEGEVIIGRCTITAIIPTADQSVGNLALMHMHDPQGSVMLVPLSRFVEIDPEPDRHWRLFSPEGSNMPDLEAETADLHQIVRLLNERLAKFERG